MLPKLVGLGNAMHASRSLHKRDQIFFSGQVENVGEQLMWQGVKQAVSGVSLTIICVGRINGGPVDAQTMRRVEVIVLNKSVIASNVARSHSLYTPTIHRSTDRA